MAVEPIDVKALRDRLGLTQAKLAEEVGVDQSTVSNWEKQVTVPRGPARKLLHSLAERPDLHPSADASEAA